MANINPKYMTFVALAYDENLTTSIGHTVYSSVDGELSYWKQFSPSENSFLSINYQGKNIEEIIVKGDFNSLNLKNILCTEACIESNSGIWTSPSCIYVVGKTFWIIDDLLPKDASTTTWAVIGTYPLQFNGQICKKVMFNNTEIDHLTFNRISIF